MTLKLKLTLFFIGGFFLIRIMGPIMVGKLKSFHQKNNTGLVEKAPWLFKFFSLFFKAASLMCLLYVVMIWAGLVTLVE